jgi:hypothetical protein
VLGVWFGLFALDNWRRLGEAHDSNGQRSASKLRWIAASDNPFGMDVLDCASVTLNLVSGTGDANVAKSFAVLRSSQGVEYRGRELEDCGTVECDLHYPPLSLREEGPAFKAREMEDKWDIYLLDSELCFCRSWTGTLAYRARVEFQPGRTNVTRIDFARARHEEPADAIRVVDFLIKSHLYGAVVPHPIPADMPNDVEKLAMYSFAQYGRRGLYASYADTTSVPVQAAAQTDL